MEKYFFPSHPGGMEVGHNAVCRVGEYKWFGRTSVKGEKMLGVTCTWCWP